MPIRANCPSCGQTFNLADGLLGKTVRCRECQNPFLVTADSGDTSTNAVTAQRPAARRPAAQPPALPVRRRERREETADAPRRVHLGWILGGIGGGVAVLLAIVLVIVLSSGSREPEDEPIAAGNPGQGNPIRQPPLDGKKVPKKRPPRKDPPKVDPGNNPFKPPQVAVVPWTVQADPAPDAAQPPARTEAVFQLLGTPQLVFPSTPSPFLAVRHGQFPQQAWQIVNLQQGQPVALIPGKLDLDRPALSPDGKFLAGHLRGGNFRQATINVYPTAGGGQVSASVTMDVNAASLRWLDFLEQNHLLTYKTHGITAHFEIWNLANGQRVQHLTLPGLLDAKHNMCLSPGRKYLAVANDSGIHIFHAIRGTKAGFLPRPLALGSCRGMAFAPDGRELVVYSAAFGSSSQLVSFNMDKGAIAVEHKFTKDVGSLVKHQFGYKGAILEWIPDKSGWLLYGQALLDYRSGSLIHDIGWPPREFQYLPRRFVGPDHVVVSVGKGFQGANLGYLALPREKIAAAVKLAAAGGGSAPSTLPEARNANLAAARELPNPGGDVQWKVQLDPLAVPKAPFTRQPIALRGKTEEVAAILFSSPEAGQAFALNAIQPNALSNRRQFRVERFDLFRGTHLGTCDLFAQDAARPKGVVPGGEGKSKAVSQADVSPGGTRFLVRRTATADRLDVWDLTAGKHLVAWRPAGTGTTLDWAGFVDDDHILTLGGGKLVLWKVPECSALYAVGGYKGTPQFSPNRKTLLLLGGAALEFIDPRTGSRLGRLAAPDGLIAASLDGAGFSPDGKELVALVGAGGRTPQFARWDLADGSAKGGSMAGPVGRAGGLLWAGPKHVLAGRQLYNWDLKSATVSYGTQGLTANAHGSPDGRWWFAHTAGAEGAALSAQKMPDTAALNMGNLIAAGQVRPAIPPGTKFQMNANGFGASQDMVVRTVTNNLKNAGFQEGPGGVILNMTVQEIATGKTLTYEVRKIGAGFGGKQLIKIAERVLNCQLVVTDAAGAVLEKRSASFSTPSSLRFSGDDYQRELDEQMWTGARSWGSSIALPTHLYRVQGQLMTLPRPLPLSPGS